MGTFPLSFRPKSSYKTGGRKFGAPRKANKHGKRLHAGCDLIAHLGAKIYAIEDGVITLGPYKYTTNVYAIEVKHMSWVVLYGEIKGLAPGLRRNSKIKEGDLIAYVGKMNKESMLHIEFYKKTTTGRLTVRSNQPYQRNINILNPAPILDKLQLRKIGG